MLITLLTDFGVADYFVGAMKGAVLSVNAGASIVDITHDIPAHDVEAGAFQLLQAYRTFPPRTVHVAVVDPGVGSARRAIVVESREHLFVGPDNGIFSYVIEREGASRVFHLTDEKYVRKPVSTTFHGRDLFAPVAGALSKGVRPESLGSQVSDYVRLQPLAPRVLADGSIEARIIHIDRFGNFITNLTRAVLTEERIAGGARLLVNGREIERFESFFAAGGEEEVFAIWGSAELLEIAAFRASAARLLGAERGQPVLVL